jgi:hypothetical protein
MFACKFINLCRYVEVHLFSDLIPTPLVAFGVAHLNAAAGVGGAVTQAESNRDP